MNELKKLFPVRPLADEFFVVEIVLNQMIRNCKQNRIFTAGPGGKPDIAHGGGVAQARVEGDEFCAIGLGFDDALGVRVEVMSRFEMT